MKSVQRKFGTFMKRSENEADVQTVLAEFKAVDDMLDQMIKDIKTWRSSWEDVLKFQYDASEAFVFLYKPIEPSNDPEMRQQPAETPAKYVQKVLSLQKEYSDEKTDLAQEITMINTKVLHPAESAKQSTKLLHKTLKHRENMKLDYERYLGRAEHTKKKETRSAKEETALATHESNLAQAQIDYQTADEQVKQTFPPVSAAVLKLLPHLLANMVMLQTTLVGQLYTVLDAYTKKNGFPNPAPGDEEIVKAWDNEFTSLRKELESGFKTIANGKAVNLAMTLPPEKDTNTLTGLGIRNKTIYRGKNNQPVSVKPAASSVHEQSGADFQQQEEDMAPPKPPRPGPMSSPSIRSPSVNLASKPRAPSASSSSLQNSSNGMYDRNPPPPYPTSPSPSYLSQPSTYNTGGGATPPSRYQTPVNGALAPMSSSLSKSGGADYFDNRNASHASLASGAASIAAAKKKPPPPVPAKRIPSSQQAQYVTALFDFEGQSESDLAFREGDRIKVVKKTDSTDDWWDGELRGRVGTFPANYVQL